jgi:hypothetical protein
MSMNMNVNDVSQWLKSFINDQNIIKTFEGKPNYFVLFERYLLIYVHTHCNYNIGVVSFRSFDLIIHEIFFNE